MKIRYIMGEVCGRWCEARGTRKSFNPTVTPQVLFWVKNNGCPSNPAVTDEPDYDPDDGTRVQRRQFMNGRDNS